jgi:hypothetical protein
MVPLPPAFFHDKVKQNGTGLSKSSHKSLPVRMLKIFTVSALSIVLKLRYYRVARAEN